MTGPRSWAMMEPIDGYTVVPLTLRPVCMRLEAAACSSITSWFTVRTAVTRSISFATRGRCSQTRTPGTTVSMAG